MFKKLLVAVDGYEPSLGAAKRAVEVAAQYNSELVVMQVEEDVPLLPEEKEAEAASLQVDRQKPITEMPLDLVAAYGKKHGVNVKVVQAKGGITGCILKVARDHNVDLISVGDSGRKGLQKQYFGSVAESVSKKTDTSILITKRKTVNISDMISLKPEVEAAGAEAAVLPVFSAEAFRRSFILGFSLLSVFAVLYFGAAMLTTAELKEAAAATVLEVPLAIWVGMITLLSGLVVTRIYLVKGGRS